MNGYFKHEFLKTGEYKGGTRSRGGASGISCFHVFVLPVHGIFIRIEM